jgi:hypothetical protein
MTCLILFVDFCGAKLHRLLVIMVIFFALRKGLPWLMAIKGRMGVAIIDSAFEPKYPVDWYNRTKADKLTSNLAQIYAAVRFFPIPLKKIVIILAFGYPHFLPPIPFG